MAVIRAETETFFRKNEMGRFVSRMHENGERLLDDLVAEGKDAARSFAPVGEHTSAPRAGHVHFKDSIVDASYSGGQEKGWGTTAKHYWYWVKGTRPHNIKGHLNFLWTNTGEHFHWENYRYGPYGSGKRYENWDKSGATVKHPGQKPGPDWMLASFRYVAALAPSYMKRRF